MRLRVVVVEVLGNVMQELVDPVKRRLRDTREQLLDSEACMFCRRRRLCNPINGAWKGRFTESTIILHDRAQIQHLLLCLFYSQRVQGYSGQNQTGFRQVSAATRGDCGVSICFWATTGHTECNRQHRTQKFQVLLPQKYDEIKERRP